MSPGVTRFTTSAAALTLAALAAVLAPACGGTTVVDAPDPDACASGHGCPMVGCACTDGSVVLDTTCERGECLPPEELCRERCDLYGGPARAVVTPSDEVPVPGCDTFCSRLQVNGCELGCDTLFTTCLTPSSCSEAAAAFWRCAVNEAVITCEDNSVHVQGCDASLLDVCAP